MLCQTGLEMREQAASAARTFVCRLLCLLAMGAFLGGWLISPLVGVGTINQGVSIGSIVVSLIGAVILLAIVNLFRRGRVR